jgi:glycosyltransferase involved in cell wall biosynthesis
MIPGLKRAFRRPGIGAPAAAPLPTDDLRARLDELERTLQTIQTNLGTATEGHAAWLADLQAGIGEIQVALQGTGATLEAQAKELKDVNEWLTSTVMTVSAMSSVPVMPSSVLQTSAGSAEPRDPLAALQRARTVAEVMAWLAVDATERETRISVVMPTRNRREYLERAVGSVLNQRHHELELVVVDDGSTDDTADFLATVTDPRVRVLRTPGAGQTAARNIGIDAATGEVVTYLDDDNQMHPGWLHAVAWAFDRWPGTQLLYGARLVEDGPARGSQPSGAMPELDFQPFDRASLELMNYIDMNAIAHRAGLPGARFEETLESSVDWLFMLRLTAEHAPLVLPVISCLYGTYAPKRVNDDPNRMNDNRLVRSRVHTTRPMRIVGFNELFPLVSETYIEEEMQALAQQGATIGYTSARVSVSPYATGVPFWDTLPEAVAALDPDLVFIYWATHADHEIKLLERVGRPFALRVHSFDFNVDMIKQLQAHRLCIGVWAFPHQVPQLPGSHAFAPIFTSHASMPEPQAVRDLVLSVSAGIPKKNFPLLVEAMDQLEDLPRGIVVSHSNDEDETIEYLERAIAQRANPPFLRVNMPRAEVFENLCRSAVLLYTVRDGVKLGMPMAIIEAMRAGCCVVHADREELRHVLGSNWRPYRGVDDIVRHVREIAAGGRAIEAERASNREFALAQFCAPERGQQFYEEVAEALARWKLRVG